MSIDHISAPDIKRSNLNYENPLVQYAIVAVCEYNERPQEASQELPSQNLVEGVEFWLCRSGSRNKAYVAEVLAAYALQFRTRLSDLTNDQVWQIAQQEAVALQPGLQTFFMTSSMSAERFAVKFAIGDDFNSQRLLKYLHHFLHFAFMQVVVREDIRAKLALNTPELVGGAVARQRINTVNPSSVVGKLVDGVTLADVSECVKGLTVPLSPGDSLRWVRDFVTAEGLVAKIYEGETCVVVRYPDLESAMYQGFGQVVSAYDTTSDSGLCVPELAAFLQHVRKVTSRAYDTVLGDAAYKRMLFILNDIYHTVLPGMEKKHAALKLIHDEVRYLRRALGQMLESDSLSHLAFGGRLLRNSRLLESIVNGLQGPASFVLASPDDSVDKYMGHLVKAFSAASALVHVHTHVQTLQGLLEGFFSISDSGSNEEKISTDERSTFEILDCLKSALSPSRLLDPKEQVDYLKDVVVNLLDQSDAFCEKINIAVPQAEQNLDDWRLHMLGVEKDDSVFCQLAQRADACGGQEVLFSRQSFAYGHAPHSLRFAVNGMDASSWKRLKQSVIAGLWVGTPFGDPEPYLQELDPAIAQMITHFPIFQRKISFPKPYIDDVLRDPDAFLGASGTILPHRREVPVYVGDRRILAGFLVYTLGTLGFKPARGGLRTEYAST